MVGHRQRRIVTDQRDPRRDHRGRRVRAQPRDADEYLPQPISTAWTLGADTNTGDGIEAGIAVGAALALMDDAWWGPTIAAADQPYCCLAERTEPGGLIVNQAGQRFVDEAAPYGDVVNAMYRLRRDRAGHSRPG